MKRTAPLLAALAASALLSAGCATEKQVSASYLLPARALTDVHSVDILAIDPVVRLSGNQAREGDSERVAGLARQLLSMELYRRGFFRTTDSLWGSMDGAAELGSLLVQTGSRHGYATLIAEPDPTKAVLRIEVDLSYDVRKTTKNQTFELKTVPYIVHQPGDANGVGNKTATAASALSSLVPAAASVAAVAQAVDSLVPYSLPDELSVTTERVESSWDTWESGGKGKMHVSLVPAGAEDPVYERDFDLEVPSGFGLASPTLLRAATTALAPALQEVVLDISPNTEVRQLSLNRSGDPRGITLLEAGAWTDAIEAIEAIPDDRKEIGDWENLGVAFEVLGDYRAAADAYERALGMAPEDAALRDKMISLAKAAKSRKDIRASGAKANEDTSFRSPTSK
jgi:hypothetical protein